MTDRYVWGVSERNKAGVATQMAITDTTTNLIVFTFPIDCKASPAEIAKDLADIRNVCNQLNA